MLVPPPSDDWASKVDPTKLKNRKFNSGRSTRGVQSSSSSSGVKDGGLEFETMQEKRKRLEDEVMGVSKSSDGGRQVDAKDKYKQIEEEETARRLREYNVSKDASNCMTFCGIFIYHYRRNLVGPRSTLSTKRRSPKKKTIPASVLLTGRRI